MKKDKKFGWNKKKFYFCSVLIVIVEKLDSYNIISNLTNYVMKNNLTKLMLVALVAILPLSIFAQKKQNVRVEKYFYLQAEGGLSINHTDLANYGGVAFYQNGAFTLDDYFLKNYNGKVGLGYQFGKVMGINAKFGTATLAGEHHSWILNPTGTSHLQLDPDNRTTFMEANLNLTFNFTNLFFGYNPR